MKSKSKSSGELQVMVEVKKSEEAYSYSSKESPHKMSSALSKKVEELAHHS